MLIFQGLQGTTIYFALLCHLSFQCILIKFKTMTRIHKLSFIRTAYASTNSENVCVPAFLRSTRKKKKKRKKKGTLCAELSCNQGRSSLCGLIIIIFLGWYHSPLSNVLLPTQSKMLWIQYKWKSRNLWCMKTANETVWKQLMQILNF